MDRRGILKIAAAGSAGLLLYATWTNWERLTNTCGSFDGLGWMLRLARGQGKPLLLFVIPRDEEGKWDRGRLFGGLLNEGGYEVLVDLALCEIACAEKDQIECLLGRRAPAGEPLAVLVETNGADLVALAIDPSLPPQNDPGLREEYGNEADWERTWKRAEERARDRVAQLGSAIRTFVAPDRATLVERAAQVRARLSPEEADALLAMAEGRSHANASLALRGAAVLRLLEEEDGSRRECVASVLGYAVNKHLVAEAPDGARWARDTGCDTVIEGEEAAVTFLCGGGFVPEVSRRFLYFFRRR